MTDIAYLNIPDTYVPENTQRTLEEKIFIAIKIFYFFAGMFAPMALIVSTQRMCLLLTMYLIANVAYHGEKPGYYGLLTGIFVTMIATTALDYHE